MPINKDKLQAREEVSSTRPKFVRPESWRYKRLDNKKVYKRIKYMLE